ncbi:MAG: hypothetical protein J0H25_06035, partial [Rhizobiales bacterium]|nr:hypothetical protein [Hyphomicrobiales bacterium]
MLQIPIYILCGFYVPRSVLPAKPVEAPSGTIWMRSGRTAQLALPPAAARGPAAAAIAVPS